MTISIFNIYFQTGKHFICTSMTSSLELHDVLSLLSSSKTITESRVAEQLAVLLKASIAALFISTDDELVVGMVANLTGLLMLLVFWKGRC